MARFYLTTAIDYVNSRPHLGHALEKIAADVIARYRRLVGDEVRFVMGNDEHSQNVYRRARELGLEPLEYCDRMEQEFRTVWARLDISYDDFIRTTEPRHRAAVQALAQRSFDRGDIYEGVYEGWYCVSCEAFKQDKDLIDGKCAIHQREPEWIRERNYFFRLSAYRDRLLELYRERPSFVEPETRRNEMLRVLEAGLEDISVSRAGQSWGIPLPFAPDSVAYVWYDALINYISAVGFGSDDALFERWWPASLHLIGKDITRFHCIVWPAMLMSAGLPLPKQVFGHGFVLFKGEKMSKSLGTVVDPLDAIERLGPDPLRLYLTKEIVFGGDGDFTWERFEERYNVDLANNLGNLVSRTTSMVERYRDGQLTGVPVDPAVEQAVRAAVEAYAAAMDDLALDRACHEAFRIVDATNGYIAASEPWMLARRDDQEALDRVLWTAVEALRVAAVLLSPVMPGSAKQILERLGAGVPDVSALSWERDTRLQSSGTRTVTRAESLWPRLEPADRPARNKEQTVSDAPQTPAPAPAPASTPAAQAPAPASGDDRISIDDFMKVELRVARVLSAERVPSSKKLMKLSVDLGGETRTIVAGIAEAYDAEALVGRHIAVVANLKPAKLMGIESNGMLLAATGADGRPILVSFDEPPAPGTRIR
ncbi:MAG: methionine--tRNA ligase [Acidobacteriota bacterium]|jgi:methionyl-tRNA synthetase|nr:MAG: methionine--tRNA ligase [Acidobacteriota bacterium]